MNDLRIQFRKLLPGKLPGLLLLPPLALAIYAASFLVRFEGTPSAEAWRLFAVTVVPLVAIKLVIFASYRGLLGWNRLVSFDDLLSLAKAATLCSLVFIVVDHLVLTDLTIPRSISLIDWGATIFVIGGLRCFYRAAQERVFKHFTDSKQVPVLIAGANDSGEALLRAIRRNSKLGYNVVGFLSENDESLRTRIGGVPVVGRIDEACERAVVHRAAEILISADTLPGKQVKLLVDSAQEIGIHVKVLPSYEQLLYGSVDMKPRTVSIEDLLRRDPVQLDQKQLHGWIDGKAVLVTGSSGSIGSEICRQLVRFAPRKLILVDRSETGQFHLERELRQRFPEAKFEVVLADLNDAMRMNHLFREHQPDIVFHAAAYKHVPLMESHPGEAVKNITLATRMLADLADQHQVGSFVMISTDKAVNPTSVMGTCKRVAELYVQSMANKSDCRFVTVRFGNVLDSAGSVVPIFREQIAQGGPVTVTHPEMRRFFMTIPEASQLVMQAGAMGSGGEIFVLDMSEPVRILDLATDMIQLSGFKAGEDIEIEFTGLRPGEKMYEELYGKDENHLRTGHAKILAAQGSQASNQGISYAIQQLAELTDSEPALILRQLQAMVPEYTGRPDSTPARLNRAA